MPERTVFSPEQEAQFAMLSAKEAAGARGIARRFVEVRERAGGRSELAELSEEAFPLEKRSLPALWQTSSPPQVDVLFSTVGTTDKPVTLTLLALRPRIAYLFHTDVSHQWAQRVEQDPEVRAAGIRTVSRTITEADVACNYEVIGRAWEEAKVQLGDRFSLSVDPTGGTKMMVAAAATWAFYRRLPLTYLYCPQEMGVPYPFAGTVLRVSNPYVAFADIELDQVRSFTAQGLYDAALALCDSVAQQVADLETAKRLDLMREWLAVCQQWDAFAHSHPEAANRPDLADGRFLAYPDSTPIIIPSLVIHPALASEALHLDLLQNILHQALAHEYVGSRLPPRDQVAVDMDLP